MATIQEKDLTPREKALADYIIEKALLLTPEIVTALFKQKIIVTNAAKNFYKENKEFKGHEDIVASVIEEVDSKNPGIQYQEMLDKAIPIIKDRVKTIDSLPKTRLSKPHGITFDGSIGQDFGDLE